MRPISAMPYVQLLTALMTLWVCRLGAQSANYTYSITVSKWSPSAADNASCWQGILPCKTLDYGLRGLRNSTKLSIESGEYKLSTAVTFHEMNNIAIVGAYRDQKPESDQSSILALVTCSPNVTAGLSFLSTELVLVESVQFSGCGILHNSTSKNFSNSESFTFLEFQVGVYFLLSKDVTFRNVTVSHSNGTGMVMYGVGGDNTFENCDFSNNLIGDQLKYPGGGGLYIEFPFCIPGDLGCADRPSNIPIAFSSHASYVFKNCRFEGNVAQMSRGTMNETFILPGGNNNVAFGRGGGLSFYLKGNATNNSISVQSCLFSANNAIWGGGLFAEFQDDAQSNKITVWNSSLDRNTCNLSYKSGGGGSRIAYLFLEHNQVHGNLVSFQRTNFTRNSAYWGGGLSFVAAREPRLDPTNELEFTNCMWTQNIAAVGAAVDLLVWHISRYGAAPNSRFTDCDFVSNSVTYSTTPGMPVGIGAMYVDSVGVIFERTINFEGNSGTALGAVATEMNISDNAVISFTRNRGRYGGALALQGFCYMKVHPNSVIIFTSNTAEYLGGAIYSHYVSEHDFREGTLDCFVAYSLIIPPNQWTAKFIFKDNVAGGIPNSIYTTSVLPCEWWYDGKHRDVNYTYARNVFCWNHTSWIYESSTCSEQIQTAPSTFTLNSSHAYHEAYQLSVIPGKLAALPVQTIDDRGINSSNRMVLTAHSLTDKVVIDKRSVYITNNQIQLFGPADSHGTLVLETQDPKVIHTKVNVTFKPCPPGLVPSINDNNASFCECAGKFGGQGYLKCFGNQFQSQLQRGAWIGNYTYKGETHVVVGLCPYCSNFVEVGEEYTNLPSDPSDLDYFLCGHVNRTGVLCGECASGFSPAVNSRLIECISCSEQEAKYSWLLYLLTEFIPLTVFLCIVLLFNVSVTTGPANSFVFFAQVLTTVFDIDGDGTVPLTNITEAASALQAVYTIPYDIWNLNFFRPVLPKYCLAPQITTVQYLSLGYITAFYPLLLVASFLLILVLYERGVKLVVIVCRPFHRYVYRLRRGWNLRNSLLDAFGTFLLLSYTKFTLVSVFILTETSLYNHKGDSIGPGVMYFSGNITFLSSEFIPYFLIAVVVLVTFVGIPPLVLVAPSVLKLLEKAGFKRLGAWQPGQKVVYVLNVFHGCYKDGTEQGTHDCRWFAGAYFVIRLLLYLLYIATPNWFVQYVWQQVICTLIIFSFTLLQPYRKDWHNKLDAFIFTVLAAINALSIHNYYLFTVGQSLSATSFALQYMLIFLPLFYMVGYASYQFWRTYETSLKALKDRIRDSFSRCIGHQNNDRSADEHLSVNSRDPDVDSEFLDYAEVVEASGRDMEPNTYRPTNPEAVCLLQNQDNSPAGGSRSNTYGSGDPSSSGSQGYKDESAEHTQN